MSRLLLLFILVPTVELILLLQVGGLIGIWPTVGIILVTGVLGAGLARQQGIGVIRQLQSEIGAGQLPAGTILDGVLILVAAALLLTPGFLTDLVGFACLVPGSRALIKRGARRWIERAIRTGRITVITPGRGP